jgi:hypothetical protein
MKVRVITGFLMILLLTMLTALQAIMGEPFIWNQQAGQARFAGQNSLRRVGETIHAVFLEQAEDTYTIYYACSTEPFTDVSYLEIDQYESIFFLGEPVLEIIPDGTVFIFYPRTGDEDEYISDLFIAEISSEGTLTDLSLLDEYIFQGTKTAFSAGDLYLLSAEGYREATPGKNLYYDKFLGLDGVEGNFRFTGLDVINGRVHSNTDIWIRNYMGWPTFNDLVTTSGSIRVYPGGGTNYPEETIFPGGLIENYPEIKGSLSADKVRMNGIRPFGSVQYDNRIAFVTINGSTYNSFIGTIVEGPVEEFIIYDSYPPYGPVGDSLGVNYITRKDTVWTAGPSGTLIDQSVFVPFELWISGNVGGRQTWASAANIYIKDDLTYQNTIPGQPPDGGPAGEYPYNETDALALISEKSIYVQYGYRHPQDSLRYKPNTQGIYIYGLLIAAGDDEPNPFDAGIFTFQYQFPKGSTPPQTWNDLDYSNIDLHRFRYPTTAFHPWPPGLDYPWYNPLWPEPGPIYQVPAIPNPDGLPSVTYLRGTIYLYGGTATRRAGFVRRSGHHDYDTGIWDIENHVFGAPTSILSPPGGAIGYDKDYYYDTRLSSVSPPDISDGYIIPEGESQPRIRLSKKNTADDYWETIFEEYGIPGAQHLCSFNEQVVFVSDKYLYFSDEGGNFTCYPLLNYLAEEEEIIDMLLLADALYLISSESDHSFLRKVSLPANEWTLLATRICSGQQQALAYDQEYIVWAAPADSEIMRIDFYDLFGELIHEYNWQHGIPRPDGYCYKSSRLALIKDGDEVTIAVYNARVGENYYGSGDIFIAVGTMDFQSSEPVDLVPGIFDLSHYPNPAFSSKNRSESLLNIRFALPERSFVNISLYNLRGQLVRSLVSQDFSRGEHEVSWDGKDNRNRKAAKGLYLYRIDTGKAQAVNKLLILD